MRGERLPLLGTLIKEINQYEPTAAELAKALYSSPDSAGRIGQINRLIATLTGIKDPDVVAFFCGRSEDS